MYNKTFTPKATEMALGVSEKEGIYVEIVDINDVVIGDLILIPLKTGGYLFSSTGQPLDSPVFKVMSKEISEGAFVLELQVMEVLAPYSLFHGEKSDHNKVLKALEVGPAVVREASVPWLIYTLPEGEEVERITIDEITLTGTIEVDPKKDRQNRCPNPVFGSVKLKEPVASAKFLLSHRPHNGVLELDEDAGTWIYLCTIGKERNDHFEITIWDSETGAYGVQVIHIWGKCNAVTRITGTVDLAEGATVSLTGLEDRFLQITGTVGLAADAMVSISGVDIHNGAFVVELTGLEEGYLPITGTVGLAADATVSISGVDIHDGAFVVELTGLEEGYLPITGTVNLAADATVSISGVNTHDGALVVELTGIKEPIDVTLKSIPLTAETIQLEITGDTLFLPASNYRRQFIPLTEAYPVNDLSAYTYLILIENLDQIDNVSFVVVEELEYTIGDNTYFAHTSNQSPEHLLPNEEPYTIRLYNPTPDPDAISSRVSILAQIEELTYRDNASYQSPALVTHDIDFEVEISAAAYLILKREDTTDDEEG